RQRPEAVVAIAARHGDLLRHPRRAGMERLATLLPAALIPAGALHFSRTTKTRAIVVMNRSLARKAPGGAYRSAPSPYPLPRSMGKRLGRGGTARNGRGQNHHESYQRHAHERGPARH